MKVSEQTHWELSKYQKLCHKSFTKLKKITWYAKYHTLPETSFTSTWSDPQSMHFSGPLEVSINDQSRSGLKSLTSRPFTTLMNSRNKWTHSCQQMGRNSWKPVQKIMTPLLTSTTRLKKVTMFMNQNDEKWWNKDDVYYVNLTNFCFELVFEAK